MSELESELKKSGKTAVGTEKFRYSNSSLSETIDLFSPIKVWIDEDVVLDVP